MKNIFKKTIKLVFFSVFISALYIPYSNAEFIYKEWDESIEFTDFGREVELNIIANVDLPSNQYYNEWGYLFDPKMDVSVQSVKVNNRSTKYSFDSNKLTITLDESKNNSRLRFSINYIVNESIHPFIRGEYVSLPKWATGAKATLSINYPYDMTVYTTHPDFKIEEYRRKMLWEGEIPEDGKSETIGMTLEEGRWEVENKVSLNSSEDKFRYVEFRAPVSFRNGNYVIERLNAEIYPKYANKITKGEEFYTLEYQNAKSDEIYFKSKGIIRNGFNFTKNIKMPEGDYLKTTESNVFLESIMEEIRASEFYNTEEPLHIIISKWVNDYVNYDIRELGKDITVSDIYRNRKGVCAHYSKIYIELCRYNNIPAVEATGVAYDLETKEFIRHSWAFVKYQGKWVPIDPTWNITSEILPVSHIFFNLGDCNEAEYTAKNFGRFKGDITINWDFDVQWKGRNLRTR